MKGLAICKMVVHNRKNKEMGETKVQGCEEKEKVLLLWERALTLFYENDTELFVTGAQERTIAGKIAMYMDKILVLYNKSWHRELKEPTYRKGQTGGNERWLGINENTTRNIRCRP